MAGNDFQQFDAKLPGELIPDKETQLTRVDPERGGWITFPFVAVGVMGLTLAAAGWSSNLTVYLIREFNVKSIDAAQISNIVNGCSSLFPIPGAIVADSFLGCFCFITISSIISLLGMIPLTLTASLRSLRPPPCPNGSTICETSSKLQLSVLYGAIALASIGVGGTRFTTATMGANQFKKAKDQRIFFNWYFFTFYVAMMIGFTVIVYVEDNVGWSWGFGVCIACNAVGLAGFLLGKRYYRCVKPHGSPFVGLARVVVATIRKWRVLVSSTSEDYYYGGHCGVATSPSSAPTLSFRFLNRAALKIEGDTRSNGSLAKPYRLCTVEQVEDLKTLIRIFPLWSTGIFLSTPIAIQISLTVLQALSMDRHIGTHFKIPAGSFQVFSLSSTALFLSIIDRFLCPVWHKLTRRSPTPFQQIGIGHVLNILGMATSAIVESRRLHVVRAHHLEDQPGSIVPMSALWLVAPLAILGAGEAFQFPGQVTLYYNEFPASLRNTATAMISLHIGIGFYLSTAVIDLVRRVTGWLPDNINKGRIDNVFWMLVVIGVVNFGYYLTCAALYKHKSPEVATSSDSANQD